MHRMFRQPGLASRLGGPLSLLTSKPSTSTTTPLRRAIPAGRSPRFRPMTPRQRKYWLRLIQWKREKAP